LNEGYKFYDYRDLNSRLAIFCVLGCGTEKNFGKTWEYLMKIYSDSNFTIVNDFFHDQHSLSLSEKFDFMRELDENMAIANQLSGYDLYSIVVILYPNVREAQQSAVIRYKIKTELVLPNII
jgi:hypothetical protein